MTSAPGRAVPGLGRQGATPATTWAGDSRGIRRTADPGAAVARAAGPEVPGPGAAGVPIDLGTVRIDGNCTACGACLSTCPTGALQPASRRPVVDDRRCTGCWECVEVCPRAAIAPWHPTTFGTLCTLGGDVVP